ncbi:flagellar hook-length control protein FliK [Variovorax sp. J2P1-59]|uniref:flagellar hook-length control protein FliK n=1 Tax=Variovorax flavidus TaxID=3053501 RepID=UPI00257796C2|nr:flagellar hook-length control protein FliK [Variovorax sp. J2P1-59]MDM0074590.1 flagellar hook-length control protein FliK [Variovorax sp. J2P1-59]
MSTLITTSVNASGTSVSSAGSRGRGAEQPDGRSFGAALDRSRAANSAAQEAAADVDTPASVAGRKLPRAGEKKSELTAADVMALLAPLPAHLAPVAVDAKAAGALASRAAKPVGSAVDGVAPGTTPALTDDAAALATASTEAGTEPATEAADAVQVDAKDSKGAAKLESAADLAFKDALAKSAPAEAEADTAATTAPTARPAVGLSTPPAAPADPAIVATGSADKAKVAAAADKAQPTPPLPAGDSIKVAAAAEATGNSLDTASESAPQPLPQLQSLAAPTVERANAPSGSTPVLSVAPPVGSDEWAPAIGQQMIRMSASGHQVAELNLNPAGLGPLKVTLTMGDSQAQAMFVSAHESVRKAVEAALPQLRTTLAEQGISLGQTSVGAETRQPFGQDAAFAQQNPSRSPNQPEYPGTGRTASAAAATSPSSSSTPAHNARAGLDTFA